MQNITACTVLLHQLPTRVLTNMSVRSALRSFASQTSPAPAPPPEKTSYGGLKDEDRIFTNLYRQGDPFIKVPPFSLCICLFYLLQQCSVHCPVGGAKAYTCHMVGLTYCHYALAGCHG